MNAFIKMLKKYWYIVVLSVIIVSLASFIISILQPAEYRSSVKLLVIQKQEGGIDAYTATRSAETIATTLSEVIYTSTFFDQVMSAGFEVNVNTFSTDPEKRKSEWKRAVLAKLIQNSGTLQIDVYDKSKNQAEQLAFSIAFVMINQGKQYHGGGTDIEIKMIDAPVTTESPARPNTLTNTVAGFILGLLASLSVIFLLSERKSKTSDGELLNVKTMPKFHKAKPEETHQVLKKETKSIEEIMETPSQISEKDETNSEDKGGSMVKNRIMQELDKVKEPPATLPGSYQEEESQPEEVVEVETPRVTLDMRKEEVGSRLAQGMESISAPEVSDEQGGNPEVVLESTDIEEDYRQQAVAPKQEDKYSPDKVDRWIKTGKFD